jgi:Na+/melibiose symporter-like transporter
MADVADLGAASGAVFRQPLPRVTVFSYSLGHVLNDLTAACWFSYLLLYLEKAQGLSPLQAGVVLFCGQIFDGLATPAVGIFSDRSRGLPALGLGRRKLWNLGGAIIVALCFLGVFGSCVVCVLSAPGAPPPTSAARAASAAVFASLFNVGWAAVQVSHMALVPELTSDDVERVLLNSARYANTVLSNCFVFLVMLAVLKGAIPTGVPDGSDDYNKATTYQTLSFIVLGVGGVCTALFLAGTPEPLKSSGAAQLEGEGGAYDELSAVAAPLVEQDAEAAREAVPPTAPAALSGAGARPAQMAWRNWLELRAFYLVTAVYALTRLATNVSQVYLSFYVTASLRMDETAIALVPLLLYISQLTATATMKRIALRFGRRNSMAIGTALIAAACGLMLTLTPQSSGGVYFAMLLLGAGSAISMVISVSMQADLIGSNTESGAFVYGAMSFVDKVANGIAILVVQYVGDAINDGDTKADYIRNVTGVLPMICIAAAMLFCALIKFPKHLQAQGALPK